MTTAGLEPAIPGSVGRCLIHWATGPLKLRPMLHALLSQLGARTNSVLWDWQTVV